MATWIDVDRIFTIPEVRFSIHLRHLMSLLSGKDFFALQSNPEEMRKELEVIVLNFRPDLAGGFVSGMQFDVRKMEALIVYHHASLPRRGLCIASETVNLDPNEDVFPTVTIGG